MLAKDGKANSHAVGEDLTSAGALPVDGDSNGVVGSVDAVGDDTVDVLADGAAGRKKPRRIFRKILSIFAGVMLAVIIFSCVSPLPVSWLLRFAFKFPQLAPPLGYELIERSVGVISDVTYPSQYGRNTLDLYLPKKPKGETPVIIWAHGGAFAGGDKTDVKYYATSLAAQGYAVVTMNYSLVPEGRYPEPVLQVAEVCAWVDSVEDEYNLDTQNLVLAGDSAGAYMVAQFTLIQNSPQYEAICGIPASIEPERIRGVMLYCGPLDLEKTKNISFPISFFTNRVAWAYLGSYKWHEEYAEQVSLKEHITSSFPPTFISDGNTLSFQEHGEQFAELLRSKDVETVSFFADEAEVKTFHEYQFKMDTPEGEECYRLTSEFLRDLFAE